MSSGPIPSPQIAATVPVTPSGNLASTNAQAALVELQGDINAINAAAVTTAAQLSVTPSGNLSSTNAQAALVELQGDVDTINAAQATTGALTLYVDPLGNDANAGTSPGASACLTIRGALSKIPKRIRHAVTVNIAAGTYAGFNVQGFTIELPEDSSRAVYLDIVGTLQNATLATGTSSGTATSGTAGSGSTYGTLSDTTQTWTVNDLVGMYLEVTSAGTTTAFPIVSNTIDTITIAGTSSALAVGLAYTIKQHATTVNTLVPNVELPAAKFSATPPAGTVLAHGLISVQNNTHAPNSSAVTAASRLTLRNLLVDGTALSSPSGFTALATMHVADNNLVSLYNCTVKSTTGATPNITAAGSLAVTRCYLTCLAAKRGIQVTGTDGVTPSVLVANSVFSGGAIGFLISIPMKIASLGSCYFSGQTSAAIQQNARSQVTTASGLKLVGGGGSTVGILINSTGGAVFGSSISSGDISGFGTAVKVDNPNVAHLGTWTGTGNTTGISATLGAAVRVGSGTTLTGTTEVSLDGTASALATMRAASPKLVVNTYTTRFYE